MDNIYVTTTNKQRSLSSYTKSIHIRNFDYNCEHTRTVVQLYTILNDLINNILLQCKYDTEWII